MERIVTVPLKLKEIGELAGSAFSKNGCDGANTQALVRTVVDAERDGSLSHGLFRIPGYVASLRSGKVNGKSSPNVNHNTAAMINLAPTASSSTMSAASKPRSPITTTEDRPRGGEFVLALSPELLAGSGLGRA